MSHGKRRHSGLNGTRATVNAMAVGEGKSTESGDRCVRVAADKSAVGFVSNGNDRHGNCEGEEVSNVEVALNSSERAFDTMGEVMGTLSERECLESADGRDSVSAEVTPDDDIVPKIRVDGERGAGSRRSGPVTVEEKCRRKEGFIRDDDGETQPVVWDDRSDLDGETGPVAASPSRPLNERSSRDGLASGGVGEIQASGLDGHSQIDQTSRMMANKTSSCFPRSPPVYPLLNDSPSSSVSHLAGTLAQQQHSGGERPGHGLGANGCGADSWTGSEMQFDGVAMIRSGPSDLQSEMQRRLADGSGNCAVLDTRGRGRDQAEVFSSDLGGHVGGDHRVFLQEREVLSDGIVLTSMSRQGGRHVNGHVIDHDRHGFAVGSGRNAPVAEVADGNLLPRVFSFPTTELRPPRAPPGQSGEDGIMRSSRARMDVDRSDDRKSGYGGSQMARLARREIGNGTNEMGRERAGEVPGACGDANKDDVGDGYADENAVVGSVERTMSEGEGRRRRLSRHGLDGDPAATANPPSSSTLTGSSARRRLFANLDVDDTPSVKLGSRLSSSSPLIHSSVTTDAACATDCGTEDGRGQEETGASCHSRPLRAVASDGDAEYNCFSSAAAGAENAYFRRDARSHPPHPPPPGRYRAVGVRASVSGGSDGKASLGDHVYIGDDDESGGECDEYCEAHDGHDVATSVAAEATVLHQPLGRGSSQHTHRESSKLRRAAIAASFACLLPFDNVCGPDDAVYLPDDDARSAVAVPASRLPQTRSEGREGKSYGSRRREAKGRHEGMACRSAVIRGEAQQTTPRGVLNEKIENKNCSSLDRKMVGSSIGGRVGACYSPRCPTPPPLCREDSIFKGLDFDKDFESSDCTSPCDGHAEFSGPATWGQCEQDVCPCSSGFGETMTAGLPAPSPGESNFGNADDLRTIDSADRLSRCLSNGHRELSAAGSPPVTTRNGDVSALPVRGLVRGGRSFDSRGESYPDGEERDMAGERIERADQDGTEVAFRTPGEAHLPPNVHVSSYLLGERTALERALHTCLPQRDQISVLHASVSNLATASQQDGCRIRQLENAGSGLRSSVSGISDRIQNIEGRLQPLESSLGEVRSGVAAYMGVVAHVSQLQDRLASVEACQHQQLQAFLLRKHQEEQSSAHGVLYRLGRVLLSHLSKVDICSLLLSQKILLDAHGMDGGKHDAFAISMSRSHREGSESEIASSSASSSKPEMESFSISIRFLSGLLSIARVPMKKQRSVMGAVLLIAAMETGWRLQGALRAPLPKFLQRMTAPMEYGMRVARMCVWMSAFVVGTAEVKRICFSIADTIARAQQVQQMQKERSRQRKSENPWLNCKSEEQRSWWPLGWGYGTRTSASPNVSKPPKVVDVSVLEPNVSLPQTPRPFTLPPPGGPQLDFDIEAGQVVRK
ncbi:hypothetical protein CBR_g12011 [Chara braunii]|uniref:Uncharacterized protein n=1 Tax=Chara braunii TaxID=69332 RepID=A0A388KR75_CHABU|nr:hypothetical protein CBR_g12011 [Chara braunii]|eukprot:GBG72433.1 hypothetical protein CBR_g12011 [Chara braunii]